MGSDSSKPAKVESGGIVTNNLILDNEVKVIIFDDDEHFWLKVLLCVQIGILLIIIVKIS